MSSKAARVGGSYRGRNACTIFDRGRGGSQRKYLRLRISSFFVVIVVIIVVVIVVIFHFLVFFS